MEVSKSLERPPFDSYASSIEPKSTDKILPKERSRSKKRKVKETSERRYAYAAVVGVWLAQFNTFGYSNGYGAFQDFYVRSFLSQESPSTISWIGSTQIFILLAGGIVAGPLFDRGYFYFIFVGGSILHIFSLFMLSLCQEGHYYQVFLAQAIGTGISSALIYVPSMSVLAHHFRTPSSRAIVMGIAASGSSVGGLLHPILLNHLFNQPDIGFRTGVMISAGMVALLQGIAVKLVRTNYPKSVPGTPAVKKPSIWKLLVDVPYMLSAVGTFFVALGVFFPVFYLQLYAIQHGISSSFAFNILTIINGASVVGRLVPGFFAAKLGVLNMITLTTLGAAALLFIMLVPSVLAGVAGVATAAAIYGFFTGAYFTLIAPLVVLFISHPSELGARMGLCYVLAGSGSLIGTPVMGALLTSRYVWWQPIVYSAITCAVGSACFLASKITLGIRTKKPVPNSQA